MKEKKFEVKTIKVRAFCACGGEYKHTDVVLMSFPPQYPHKCSQCGKESTFSKKYPYVDYAEIE